MKTNVLYYGDNIDILRRYIPDESVDLVYLDPPFNSNATYNVIFKDESGRRSDAQLLAFEDTWHWGPDAEATFAYLTNTARHEGRIPRSVTDLVDALYKGLGPSQMLAYIVEMAVRLVELHRVLKPTGSLYLHCDPTASSYLRVLLDAIFGPERFLNEVTWKRTTAHNDPNRFGRVADRILFYSKTATKTFNRGRGEHSPEQMRRYKYADAGGPFRAENLTAPHFSATRTVEWRGVHPGADRQWRFSIDELERLYAEGRILLQRDGRPRKDGYKTYLSETAAPALQDIWTDIALPPTAAERLGYPTQKPVALLERIIEASSNPGDIILDPFCGCGTALVASEKLGRRWVGIDITYLAIAVMRARLKDSFGLEDVPVECQPTEVEGARQLAAQPKDGRYQFQWWALGLVDAKPVGGPGAEKKGSDRGIDGVITFTDVGNEVKTVIVSVKSGGVNSGMVRDLKGTLEREKAAIGLFVTLEEPTKEMRLEADTAGLFHSELWHRDYRRLQILTIRELLEGTHPDLPPFVMSTYQKAEKVQTKPAAEQQEMFGT